MRVCEKCNTEFEGEVCPVCAAEVAQKEEKAETVEPVAVEVASEKKISKKGRKEVVEEPFDNKKYFKTLAASLPLALFALFSVLMFAFYALPIATIRSNSLGSLYSINALYADDFATIKYVILGVTALCVAYAAVSCLIAKVTLAKDRGDVVAMLSSLSYLGYVAVFVCGVLLSSQVSSTYADLGDCVKLCIAMPIVFAVLSLVSSIVTRVLCGTAKLALGKTGIVVLAVVAAIAVVVGVTVPLATDSFNESKFSSIKMGDSAKSVREKLGKPDYEINDSSISSMYGNMFIYVNREARSTLKNSEYLSYYNGYLPTEEKIDDIVKESTDKLQSEVLKYLTKGLVVIFDNEGVASLVYNADCSKIVNSLSGLANWDDKTIKNAEVADVLPYVDWETHLFEISIHYTDGSYMLTKMNATDCEEKNLLESPSRLHLTFTDNMNNKFKVTARFANLNRLSKQIYEDYEYVQFGQNIVITKYLGDDKNVILPATIRNKKVAAIGEGAFVRNATLETVQSSSVTMIYAQAFEYCANLEGINFPNVEYIGNNAFSTCSKLQYLTLEKIKWIGDNAFLYDVLIKSLSLSYTPLTAIGKNAMFGCEELASINVPSTLEYIGEGAFQNSGLEYAVFPTSNWVATRGSEKVSLRMTNPVTIAGLLTTDYVQYTWTKESDQVEYVDVSHQYLRSAVD